MITPEHLQGNVGKFWELCMYSLYPNDVYPLTYQEASEELGISNDKNNGFPYLGLESKKRPIEYISELITTPRLLKYALRHCLLPWEHLHGEVNFNDLLVISILRTCAPEAFNFVLTHYSALRSLQEIRDSADRTKKTNELDAKWSLATQGVSWNVAAAKKLTQFLFYGWRDGHDIIRKQKPLQSVQEQSPTDYLNRIIVGELPEDEVRDQSIIIAIDAWKKANDNPSYNYKGKSLYLNLLDDKNFGDKFEYFSERLFKGEEIRAIASEVFMLAIKKYGKNVRADVVHGFIPLWRLSIHKPIPTDSHQAWLLEEVKKAISISLRFANDIYYYWRTNREDEISAKAKRSASRPHIVAFAQNLFSDHPTRFLEILDPKYLYCSYHFCYHFSELDEGDSSFKSLEWAWFSNLLLDAGKIDHQCIIPQIVCFVIDEQRSFEAGFTYHFKEQFASEFWADRYDELMQLLAKPISYDGFDEREVGRLEEARSAALAWINRKNEPPRIEIAIDQEMREQED